MKFKNIMAASGAMLIASAISGCATSTPPANEWQTTINQLQKENQSLRNSVATAEQRAQAASQAASANESNSAPTNLPPNAKAGECYARVLEPAKYETREEVVTIQAASEKVTSTAPVYKTIEKTIVVKEAWEEVVEVTPAQYEWVEETIVIEQSSERLEPVPAEYRTEKEKILVTPAYTTWKKGRGPIERIDHATGEIMCLIEVPAEYKTVTKNVLVSGESTRAIAIPAKTQTIKRQVMVKAPVVKRLTHPAETKTVKVKVLDVAAKEIRTAIPAKTKTITQQYKTADSKLSWRSVMCETNITGDIVKQLQSALKARDYDPVWIDGVYGAKTSAAVTQYQKDNNMASGGLTFETLDKLGVKYRRVQ